MLTIPEPILAMIRPVPGDGFAPRVKTPATSVAILLSTLVVCTIAPLHARADDEEPAATVESVQVAGNQYVSADTLLYYVSTKPGNRYDPQTLREDFRRLWDTGFVDDLNIDVRDGEKGKIVTFRVVERK